MSQRTRSVVKGQKRLRCGYTTGTCAAAAAKGAAVMLLEGKTCRNIEVTLPIGETVVLEPVILRVQPDLVQVGVVKDAGDDPDVTHGMLICASVSKREEKGLSIDGGEGVGRVTRAGLDQPIGAAAINTVPRQMIAEAVASVMEASGYEGGLSVCLSIPGGEERAARTMNPLLGIEGGLSILGTTGIVEPMSEQALVDTIAVDIRMHRARGERELLMAPGNYGLDFLAADYGIHASQVIKISNYIGDSVDLAVYEGAAGLLLAGHVGKLIKVAGGIMNTHSHQADARMEILTAYGAMAGAESPVLREIMGEVTTDAGLAILKAHGLMEKTMTLITERVAGQLRRRAREQLEIGVILFSNVYGLLGKTDNAEQMLQRIRTEDRMDKRRK